ncbi:MAG: OsmC family protein [Candidatus Limnocylindrales bacterium]
MGVHEPGGPRLTLEKTARVRWAGGLRFEAATGLGGALTLEATDDVPGARPSETMLAALAACAGADVVSILGKKRQPVTTYEISVRGLQADEHPKVFRTIDVLHVVGGDGVDLEAVRRSVELSATRYCVVTAQLSSGDVVIAHRCRVGDGPELEVAETGPQGRIVVHPHGPED